MKSRHVIATVAAIISALVWTGCGSKEAERQRAEKERTRIELEEKARREAETANKAITDINRRMFGKKPAAPTEDKDAQSQEKKPTDQPSTPPPKS